MGTWTVTNGLGTVAGAVGRAGFGAVISQGYVYALGGFVYTATDSGHIASDNNAYYAPLQGQAAVSHYSMQLTTDRPTLPANFFLNTTKLAGSTITVGLGTATTTSPAFGSINATSNPVAGSKYNIGITGDGVNYYWVAITLDDSKAMAFGETGGSKVSYFQLNYHPNVGMRLRGGKTFNSQQLQSLDAY